MNKKYIIALYIRLSLEDAKVDSFSIHNQKLALNKYAETLVDTNDYEIMEFVDNGYSGTNFERPAVQELLELVKNFKINCIIVKDFSRFGRNSIETGYFIERVFPLFKVRFISINDNFDTNNYNGDTGGMEFAFKNLINEYYSIDLSRKSKTAKYTKMRKGEYQSKLCPLGYKKGKNNRLEIESETAEVVKMIFQLVLQGKTNVQIIKILYENNIPTPGEFKAKKGEGNYDISRCGGMWCSSAISRIITDERYIGTYIICKRALTEVGGNRVRLKDESEWIKIPEHHQAIISKEDFEKAQKIRKTFKCDKKIKHIYPLRSKVICGCCNHTMERRALKSPIFDCRYSLANEKSPCYKLKIEESELHSLLFDIISKQTDVLLNTDNLRNVKSYDDNIQKKIDYENLIKEYYKNKRNLYEKLLLKEIDLQMYNELKSEYDNKISSVKNSLSEISLQSEMLKSKKDNMTILKNVADIISNENTFTQTLSDLLINKVFIYPGNRVEVVWKVQGFI